MKYGGTISPTLRAERPSAIGVVVIERKNKNKTAHN